MLAVGPPSARHLLTYTLYRLEIWIRDTAIAGVVGAAGLGRLLQDRLRALDFAAVSGVLIASFVVSAGRAGQPAGAMWPVPAGGADVRRSQALAFWVRSCSLLAAAGRSRSTPPSPSGHPS